MYSFELKKYSSIFFNILKLVRFFLNLIQKKGQKTNFFIKFNYSGKHYQG